MAHSIDGFVREIVRRDEGKAAPLQLRYAIVDAVNATTLDITIGGGAVTDVAMAASVSATAGDRVAVIDAGGNLLVICVVA